MSQMLDKRARLEEIVDQINELLYMSTLEQYEPHFGVEVPMDDLNRMLEECGGFVANVHMAGEIDAPPAPDTRPTLHLKPEPKGPYGQ